jgi:outer membrane protein, adhesin transport system
MRIFNKPLLVLVAAILFMNGGVAWGETLQDAIKYMLQTNPNIKAASYNRLAKNQEVNQGKAGYFPSLDVSSGVGVLNQSHPYNDTVSPRSTVVSLRQNVFRFFGTEYEVNRLKYTANSQAYQLQGTSESIALQGAKVYLDVLRNLELQDLAKENVTNHQRISDQMKLRSVSGVDRKADLDQVMGRFALAQSNLAIAAANIADAKTSYLAVIGRLPEDLTIPQSVGSVIPESMEESERVALQGYPILKSAQADLDARLAQYETAKSQLYPTIDVAVNYSWLDNASILAYRDYQENLSAIASVNFNIFNGWYNKARITQTAQQIKEAEEIRNNTKRQIVQSVRLSWEAYKTAQERVTYLTEYVKAAGLTADAFTAQWNIGRRTMFDLLDTQAELINAKASLVNAKYDNLYAEYRVLNSVGKLVNTFGLQWPDESRIEGAMPDAPRPAVPALQKDSATIVPPVAPPPSVAPPVIETPKPAQTATVPPPVSEPPKAEEMKTPPAEVSSVTDGREKQSQPAAVASPLPTALTDRPKIIKGIVLTNGKVIEGKIVNMNVSTVKILTKDGKEKSYSFDKEVKGFIKE